MVAVTICRDSGDQEKKICHCFHFLAIYFPWSGGIRCHDLSFLGCWALSQRLHSLFSSSSKRIFSSSSLFVIKVISFTYLRLLIFLSEILILACDSSSPVWRDGLLLEVNKQCDNIQPWCTPFSILNQSVVPCKVLTVVSWFTYRFLRKLVRWS